MKSLIVVSIFCSVFASVEYRFDDDDANLNLLQLTAKRSKDLAEEVDELGVMWPKPTWPPRAKPAFGPDGTWNTPFCKDIQGCTPYCPDGCNGGALWDAWTYPSTKFGVPAGRKPLNMRIFLACKQGYNPGGPIGSTTGLWMNCFNSENSSKPWIWGEPAQPAAGETNGGLAKVRASILPGYAYAMDATGYEFCPKDCVNDCAQFKWGNFQQCGVSGRSWIGYNGGTSPDIGSNDRCNSEFVTWAGGSNSYLWCGGTTTTTTTTTTPAATTPAATSADIDDIDEASAVGDPHIKTPDGHKFDVN